MDEDIALPAATLMTRSLLCSRRKSDAASSAAPLFAHLGECCSGDVRPSKMSVSNMDSGWSTAIDDCSTAGTSGALTWECG
jgi:hypothetical protein